MWTQTTPGPITQHAQVYRNMLKLYLLEYSINMHKYEKLIFMDIEIDIDVNKSMEWT